MQWFLRFRVCIIICIAVLLITAAVMFSVVRAVLPYATGYKSEVQQEISKQIGLPVEIDSISAEIYWFTPRLKLNGVIVYDAQHIAPLFDFKEAFVGLDVIGSILRGELIADDVGLVRADISIEKFSETEWIIQGIKVNTESSDEDSAVLPGQLIYMIKNSDYLLHDSNIYYQDHTGDKLNLKLLDVNIDVRNNFNNHDIKFSMNLPESYGEYLAVVANLHGDIDSLEGDIYVDAKRIDIKQWKQKFKLFEDFLINAVIDVELWATLDKSNIQSLLARVSSENLVVKNLTSKKSWQSNYLSTNLRYVQDGERWNISVSDFYFGNKLQPAWGQEINILASEDESFYYFSADMLRYYDLKNIAEVFASEQQLIKLDELSAYQLSADVYNINLRLPSAHVKQDDTAQVAAELETVKLEKLKQEKVEQEKVGQEKAEQEKAERESVAQEKAEPTLLKGLYLQATVNDLSIFDPGRKIRANGFDASILIDREKITLDLATESASVEMNEIFREPISAAQINGTLQIMQNAGGWKVQTDKVQLSNKHIKTFSRFDMQITADNEVSIDAQSNFYDGYGKFARHYLPVGVMSEELINWLDMAVTDGYVPEGKLILHGKLNDFPYDEHNGVFQVFFAPEKVNMQFLEGWPPLQDASGIVKFNNLALYLTKASGRTMQASLFDGYAEILNLPTPLLSVKTRANALNEDVQAYVWQSPLDDVFGDSLRLFQFEGSGELSLGLDIPLYAEQVEVVIDGQINFINSSLYYHALGYEIKDINGVIDFTKENIFADTIKAKIQDQPVLINAFTQVGDSGQEVVFHLDGRLQADYLLQRYDWIPQHWVSGSSNWSMDVFVPNDVEDYLVHIKASTNLEDVVLDISDKVNKSSGSQLALTTDIDVLADNALYIKTVLTDSESKQEGVPAEIVNLFSIRDENEVWKFDIKSDYMTGTGEFTEGLPKETQVALDLENIDVHALFVSENKNASDPLKPSDFPPLNWKAKTVIWDDWVLSDVAVETDWNKHGMLINRYSFSGHEMNFNAKGTWLTSWRGAHETVLQGTINSNNIGVTLSGLGFQRSVDRAKFSASFNSKWPAEPYGLSWANMKGKTTFAMKDGEILEVDPGAGGRLLGLLNIFRLANRLALDFDDVTRKGYSFDSIDGEFEFIDGDGSMNNFEVSAAAADMTMFGSIGMVDHDYGLLMRVKPHTDSLTFAGAALLGGVAVGAGLALVQKIFDLSVIGHNVYSITGTWDEPIIEKIVEKSVSTSEDDDF